MYYKLEEGKFVGFYEEVQEEGTFVEITIDEWNHVLDKQAEGKAIYYNSKTKKLDTLKLGKFEELKGDTIITNIELLKQSILSELSELKTEHSEKEFVYKEKYLQKNREKGDRGNLTGIVVLLMATGQKEYDGWKVLDKDTREHVYLKLSLNDLKILALHMQEQVTKALKTESSLIEKLETLTDEELKNYKAAEEFEKLWN